MACPFNRDSLSQLKSFVDLCAANTDVLFIPELSFFKDFIESLGGKLPPPKEKMSSKKGTPTKSPAAEPDVESDPESDLEISLEGCLEPDADNPDQVMGNGEKEPTEEEIDQADELRRIAMALFSEGEFEKTVDKYTEAILINPLSAILFTKRGQAYIKLNKPNACIKDCSHALELNCDSAPAYKFRGRAFRLIGEWEKAAKDLRQAVKIDFDDQANEWLNEVQPIALKIEQHQLKLERKKLDKEEREKLERIRKAREAHVKAAESNADQSAGESGPAGAGGMPDFFKMMQDPEIMAAFQDPECAAAFQDISTNPANIMKYQNNPKVQALIEKLSSKFTGGGGGMGGFPGFAGFPGAGGPPETAPHDDGLD